MGQSKSGLWADLTIIPSMINVIELVRPSKELLIWARSMSGLFMNGKVSTRRPSESHEANSSSTPVSQHPALPSWTASRT